MKKTNIITGKQIQQKPLEVPWTEALFIAEHQSKHCMTFVKDSLGRLFWKAWDPRRASKLDTQFTEGIRGWWWKGIYATLGLGQMVCLSD